MSHKTHKTARPGFTMVELLVGLAIMVTLATLALAIVPNALSQDRTSDAANVTRQWLMVAKARAARDQLPRGVRLVAFLPPPQPTTITSPAPISFTQNLVQELQFIESPPPLVPANGAPGGPFVTITAGPVASPTPGGAWTCTVTGLTLDQMNQIGNDVANGTPPTLALPNLGNGVWPKITNISSSVMSNPGPIFVAPAPQTVTLSLQAGSFDQSQLGSGTMYSTSGFAFYFNPRPLLGEPTLQLPTNTCIDLTPTSTPASTGAPFVQAPSSQSALSDADILFAPNGQVIPTNFTGGTGQLFLWVRDYTKTTTPLIVTGTSSSLPIFYVTPFQQGGEQQLVTLKTKSGGLGVFPVAWPNVSTGQYSGVNGQFTFAQSGVTSP